MDQYCENTCIVFIELCVNSYVRDTKHTEESKANWHYSSFTEKNHLIDMTILVLGIPCRFLDYITWHLYAGMLMDKEKIEQNEERTMNNQVKRKRGKHYQSSPA